MPSLNPRVRSRHLVRVIRRLAWRVTSQRALEREIKQRIRSGEILRLQVGTSRNHLPGWLNTDIVPPADFYLDATNMTSVPDASVDFMFGEHFIEHLTLEDAKRFACEAARVMKPGGVLRLATPDLRRLAESYVSNSQELLDLVDELKGRGPRRFGSWGASAINQQAFSWTHQYLHDAESLGSILEEAGFGGIRQAYPGLSSEPDLGGIEQHELGTALDGFMLVLEAVAGEDSASLDVPETDDSERLAAA